MQMNTTTTNNDDVEDDTYYYYYYFYFYHYYYSYFIIIIIINSVSISHIFTIQKPRSCDRGLGPLCMSSSSHQNVLGCEGRVCFDTGHG